MAAADSVLVPLQCEFFALEGLSQLLETVEQVRRSINPDLTIQGIVLTMFDGRNNLANQVVDDVRAHMGDKVYETVIPRNVRISEAPSYGKPAILYDPQMQRQPSLSATRIGSHPPGTAAACGMIDSIAKRMELSMSGRSVARTAGPRSRRADRRHRPRPSGRPRPRVGADGKVPIEFIAPNPRNPRRSFGEADLADLAQSLREHGLVQPVVVRPAPSQPGHYEIIAGERRWRAAQRAGVHDVPVTLLEINDKEALETRDHRERAARRPQSARGSAGYQQLIDEHNYTQADLGQVIGKSRSHVANTLRLLKLPDVIRDMLVDGALSAGHARTLVTAADPAGLAKKIVEGGLSVRQAEALAQQPQVRDKTKSIRTGSTRTPIRWRWRSC